MRYKTLLDVRFYKGAWDSRLDLSIVNDAIAKFTSQPAAYCLDFGVDANGKYYLIEVVFDSNTMLVFILVFFCLDSCVHQPSRYHCSLQCG